MTWYRARGGKPTDRLVLEVTKMKLLFDPEKATEPDVVASWDVPFEVRTLVAPKFQYKRVDSPLWKIRFTMRNLERGDFNPTDEFQMKIQYPVNYPADEPRVTLPSHHQEVINSPHRFGGGVLCLHNHNSSRTGWDPAKSTAATFALWSIQWIRTLYYWKHSGRWPDST